MDGTVLNNASSNVQIYMKRTTSFSGEKQPELQSFMMGQVPVIGSGSSSDIPLLNEGDYIYCGVWDDEATIGTPDSWMIFSIPNIEIVQSEFNQYVLTVSGNTDTGVVITISDGSGKSPSSKDNNNTLLIVIIMILGLLLLIGLGLGAFFILRGRGTRSTAVVDTDLPVFIPKY